MAASSGSGPRLLIGTGANVSSERLIRHADAPLRMLAHETGETAVVVRRTGLSSICLHQIESDAPLRVTLEPGEMSPLYAGAPGRVLLAFAPSRGARRGAGPGPRPDHRLPRRPRTELRAGLGRDRHDRDGDQRGRADRGLGRDRRRRSSARTGSSGRSRSSDPRSAAGRHGGRGPGGCSRRRARAINAALAEDRTP